MFADDTAVVSDTTRGLQHQFDLLAKHANALDLSVNLERSNIVIFLMKDASQAMDIGFRKSLG